MHSAQPSGKVDIGVAALIMLAHYHQITADANQLRHHSRTHERPCDSFVYKPCLVPSGAALWIVV